MACGLHVFTTRLFAPADAVFVSRSPVPRHGSAVSTLSRIVTSDSPTRDDSVSTPTGGQFAAIMSPTWTTVPAAHAKKALRDLDDEMIGMHSELDALFESIAEKEALVDQAKLVSA